MSSWPVLGALGAMILAVAPAAAASNAFASGDFAAAREIGRSAGTADGAALACKSGLILAAYFETQASRVKSLHDAIEDCADAIKAGAAAADVHVDYAVGLAFESKRTSNLRYAAGAKRLLAEAIARFPDSALAHGALGGWHATVARRGRLARIVLGANRESARKEFLTALRLDPGDIAITSEYVRFLAGGNRKDRQQAVEIAASALSIRPIGAFEVLLTDRIRKLSEELRESPSAVEAAIEELGPFPGIAGDNAQPSIRAPFVDTFEAVSNEGE